MKRIIAFVIAMLVALTLVPTCYADLDLSGLSYDELVALKDKINLAIWDSEEWQEVEVPQGVWAVGEDIPAGKWTIKALPGGDTYIKIGLEVKDGGNDVNSRTTQRIKDEGHSYYDSKSDITSWTYDFTEGQYVKVDNGPAVFTPYSGKPTLGFKK